MKKRSKNRMLNIVSLGELNFNEFYPNALGDYCLIFTGDENHLMEITPLGSVITLDDHMFLSQYEDLQKSDHEFLEWKRSKE